MLILEEYEDPEAEEEDVVELDASINGMEVEEEPEDG